MTVVDHRTGEVVEFDKAAAERRAERITLRLDAIARKSEERLSATTQVHFIIRSWNAWRRGEELHVLKVRTGDGKGSTVSIALPKAV